MPVGAEHPGLRGAHQHVEGQAGFGLHLAAHGFVQGLTEPVQPGEEGELVITTLDKVASPVVRFRTADKVRFFTHDYCDCGRPFNLIECGTIARFDDMVKVKGLNIWPQTLDELLFSYPEIEEYNAKVIVEISLSDFPIDASLGSHFFHNITSMNIGYLSVLDTSHTDFVRWDILNQQKIIEKTNYLKHVRFEKTLTVYMDGRKKISVIITK